MRQEQTTNGLSRARRAFFERGIAPPGEISDVILHSWQRCLKSGLAVERRPQIEPITHSGLRELRGRNQRLWHLAKAELESLCSNATTTGSIVILTDHQGWILDAAGHPQFLNRAGRVALMPGACWNEAHAGTNAIGTAIVEDRCVEVKGSEHYHAPHGILSCSATPIYDPFGALVGVLDITGDSRAEHLHAMGLVQMAVANIERRYFDDGIDDSELLRLHRDPAMLGTAQEALLAFRNGRLVAANRAGLALAGLQRNDIGRIGYDALFEDSLSRLRADGVMRDRAGRALYGCIQTTSPAPASISTAARAGGPRIATSPESHAGASNIVRIAPDAPLFDATMDHALTRACRVLNAGLPVLISGETGTGKEVFARELHRRCARAGQAFVAVNCAALPEGLIEAELFGYEEGAFTGARRNGSPGLLRQANGGVLFLDEIGDMPLSLQPRLLRVLQDKELHPLGGGKPVKLDFAVICATHHDLDSAITEGLFRADLYFRIAHHCVRTAPLREHANLPEVIAALWQRIGQGRTLSPRALAALAAYTWPGNLRQLTACLRTLTALSDADAILCIDALPAYVADAMAQKCPAPASPVADARQSIPQGELSALEEAAMREAMSICDGNVSRAARRLGVSRSTLYRRLGKPNRS